MKVVTATVNAETERSERSRLSKTYTTQTSCTAVFLITFESLTAQISNADARTEPDLELNSTTACRRQLSNATRHHKKRVAPHCAIPLALLAIVATSRAGSTLHVWRLL